MKKETGQRVNLQCMSYLEAIKIFEEFDKEILRDLASRIRPIILKKGETLFSQGDNAEAVYFVIRGCLQGIIEQKDGRKNVVLEMEEGSPVGEMALFLGGRRTASAVAARKTTLVELTREDFEEVLSRHPGIKRQMLDVVFHHFRRMQLAKILPDYFGDMNEATFDYIESQFEWLHIKRGDTLVRDSNNGGNLFILINGLLHVIDGDTYDPDKLIAVITVGKTVGEIAVLTDEKGTANIYAARDSDLVKLSKSEFERIRREYPQVMVAINRILIHRLKTKCRCPVEVSTAVNIALVPTGPGAALSDFTERLIAALPGKGPDGPTYLVTSEGIDRLFNKKGISQISEDDPLDPGLCTWLTEIESTHSLVIYRADSGATPWTKRCLARADKVLLLAGASSKPGAIEKELSKYDNQTIPVDKALVLIHPDDRKLPSGTAKWLNERDVQNHYHIRWNRQADFERLARILTRRAIGLALGGGCAKGLVHIGVIRALEEAGIPIDMVSGASMGSIIGAQYAMGKDYRGMLAMCKKLFIDNNPFKEYTLPMISLLRNRKLEYLGKLAYGEADIEDLWINFLCVSSNLTTSELEVHRRGPLWKAVRASSALPGVVPPVFHCGEVFVDGGVINNLPGDILHRHCGIVIAVEANPKMDLSVQIEEIPSPWKVLWSKLCPFKKAIKVPSIVDIMMSTIQTASYRSAISVKQEAHLSLTPPVADVGYLDFKSMEKTAEIGYRYTKDLLARMDDGLFKSVLKGQEAGEMPLTS